MKLLLACCMGILLVSGSMAQNAACDPATEGTALVDLADPIGVLACRVPKSVNLTATLSSLTGVLENLNLQQLKQLPAVLKLSVNVKPTSLEPFFSLSAEQLNRLVPLLTSVKADTLKEVFPLLAAQPEGTVDKMVRFLQKVPRSQLEQLSPVFSSLTQNQINVLVHALNVLPEQALMKLSNMLRALGPVTDSVVAVKQSKGLLPSRSSSTTTSSGTVSGTSSSQARSGTITIGPGMIFGGLKNGKGIGFGRKMLQSDEERAAAALAAAAAASESSDESAPAPEAADPNSVPDANGCIASVAGIEIGVALVGDFGAVVCKFGADNLRPIMAELLDVLNKAPPSTLAGLPQLTAALTRLDPKAFDAFFKIPSATLEALLPVLDTLDPKTVSVQLTAFGNLDAATIDNMIYFLQNISVDSIKSLLPLFSRLSDSQVDTLANLLGSLSPGQVTLGLHLLSVFGPAIDVIGQHIPQQQNRGNTFMIGPIRVTMNGGGSSSSGTAVAASNQRLRLPFFG